MLPKLEGVDVWRRPVFEGEDELVARAIEGCAFYLFIRVMEITDILSQNVPVLSKNTNELKTGAPGRFGSETSEAWPMEARILGHEEAEPALNLVGRRHRWLAPA